MSDGLCLCILDALSDIWGQPSATELPRRLASIGLDADQVKSACESLVQREIKESALARNIEALQAEVSRMLLEPAHRHYPRGLAASAYRALVERHLHRDLTDAVDPHVSTRKELAMARRFVKSLGHDPKILGHWGPIGLVMAGHQRRPRDHQSGSQSRLGAPEDSLAGPSITRSTTSILRPPHVTPDNPVRKKSKGSTNTNIASTAQDHNLSHPSFWDPAGTAPTSSPYELEMPKKKTTKPAKGKLPSGSPPTPTPKPKQKPKPTPKPKPKPKKSNGKVATTPSNPAQQQESGGANVQLAGLPAGLAGTEMPLVNAAHTVPDDTTLAPVMQDAGPVSSLSTNVTGTEMLLANVANTVVKEEPFDFAMQVLRQVAGISAETLNAESPVVKTENTASDGPTLGSTMPTSGPVELTGFDVLVAVARLSEPPPAPAASPVRRAEPAEEIEQGRSTEAARFPPPHPSIVTAGDHSAHARNAPSPGLAPLPGYHLASPIDVPATAPGRGKVSDTSLPPTWHQDGRAPMAKTPGTSTTSAMTSSDVGAPKRGSTAGLPPAKIRKTSTTQTAGGSSSTGQAPESSTTQHAGGSSPAGQTPESSTTPIAGESSSTGQTPESSTTPMADGSSTGQALVVRTALIDDGRSTRQRPWSPTERLVLGMFHHQLGRPANPPPPPDSAGPGGGTYEWAWSLYVWYMHQRLERIVSGVRDLTIPWLPLDQIPMMPAPGLQSPDASFALGREHGFFGVNNFSHAWRTYLMDAATVGGWNACPDRSPSNRLDPFLQSVRSGQMWFAMDLERGVMQVAAGRRLMQQLNHRRRIIPPSNLVARIMDPRNPPPPSNLRQMLFRRRTDLSAPPPPSFFEPPRTIIPWWRGSRAPVESESTPGPPPPSPQPILTPSGRKREIVRAAAIVRRLAASRRRGTGEPVGRTP